MGVLLIAFTIINFIIYHKIFTVWYFNLGDGLYHELLGCLLVAMFECAIIITVGPIVLGIILAIALIVGVIAGIKETRAGFKKFKEKQESESFNINNKNSQDIEIKNAQTWTKKTSRKNGNQTVNLRPEDVEWIVPEETKKGDSMMYCPFCGKQIERGARFCNFCGENINKK